MDQAVVDLNQKIDVLTQQVAYLTEQAEIAERQRNERAELIRDLTPIANEAFRLSVEQLEEIQEYVELNDLLRFVKRVARNGRNFEKMLSQLEGLMDLVETLGPLADEAFGKAVAELTEMERKGYFAFARGGAQIMDNIVTSFSEEDVNRLGDNVVLILNTVKDMTQPEIMNFVRNTLMVAEKEIEKPVDITYTGLMRQMRDPEVRRGLALTMRVLHVVGSQAGNNGSSQN
ncbi:MAG: DUF1641 domain-containing protein [Chloroflexota bacterium]|nr:MAG: DUF1641 domain-containing protein [Chloroflexota bacterium]